MKGFVLSQAAFMADQLFDDSDCRAAFLNTELSVHDAADAFRSRLEQRLRHKRVIDGVKSLPPCLECGLSATHPAHDPKLPPGLEMRASVNDPGAPAHRYRHREGEA